MSMIASHSSLNISEAVREALFQKTADKKWPMVSQTVTWPMAVTDDFMWLWKVKLVTPIRLEPNISKTAGDAI